MAGSNPGMFIRIAANIVELKKNLADGSAMINTTTAAMTKMAASLDGNKLMQHAQNIVASVHQIGGATKLTEAEKARLNVTLTKAIEKYQVMGQVAPKAMIDLEGATRKVATETETATKKAESWKSQLSGLAGAFGIAFSVGAVVSFGRELLKMGDEIVRVSDRTGLTIKEVQQFTYVAGQSGNTIDELTGAIGQMQNRLASGDKSAVAAVKDLGINFQTLIGASPAKQMEMIATEIAKIPDPAQRTAVAMDLFGKTGTAILPTLTSQFGKLAAAAPVMSDKTVRALDTAGDQLARFGLQIKVWAAESYNFLSSGFEKMIAACYRGVAAFLVMTAKVIDMTSKIPGASFVLDKMGVSVKGLTDQATWFRDAAGAMAVKTDVVTEAAKRLSPELDYTGKKAKEAAASIREKTAAAEKAAEATAKWDESIRAASFSLRKLVIDTNSVPPAIQSMNVSMDAYNLIAEHGVDAMLEHSEATKKSNAELARLGMILPNVAIHSGNVSQEIYKGAAATTTWRTQVGQFAGSLTQLAQVSGGTFGGIVQDIGRMVAAFDMAIQASDAYAASTTRAGKAIAVLQGATAVWSATEGGGAKGILGGAASGAAAGAMFGPWGMAVGAVAGGLIGAFRGGGPSAAQQATAQIKAIQVELLKTHGSLDDIRRMGDGAGAALADAWGSQNQEGLKWFTQLANQFDSAIKTQTRDVTAGSQVFTNWGSTVGLTTTAAIVSLSQVKAQLAGLHATTADPTALQALEDQMAAAAAAGVTDFSFMAANIELLKGRIGAPIHIAVTMDPIPTPTASNWQNFPTGDGGRGPQDVVPFDVWIEDFVKRNGEQDRNRGREAYGNSFAMGTPGLGFMDFGAGTPVTLHGRERVITESQGRSESMSTAGMEGRLASIERMLRNQPRAFGIAMKEAAAFGGSR